MITRLAAKFLGATYILIGVVLLIAWLVVMLPTLQEASSWATYGTSAILFFIGAVPLIAGTGLWKQRTWSKWLFLLTACLAFLPSLFGLPAGMELYQHYKQPPPGSYKVLSQSEFIELFTQFVLQPFGVAVLALVAAAFTFIYFRPLPNPSIERTSPGKPGAASHLKR